MQGQGRDTVIAVPGSGSPPETRVQVPSCRRQKGDGHYGELTSRYAGREFTAVLKRANFRSLGLLQRLGFVPAPADLLAQTGIEPDELVLYLHDP